MSLLKYAVDSVFILRLSVDENVNCVNFSIFQINNYFNFENMLFVLQFSGRDFERFQTLREKNLRKKISNEGGMKKNFNDRRCDKQNEI